jgi:hypothetical protein
MKNYDGIKGTLLDNMLDNYINPKEYADILENMAEGENTLLDYEKRSELYDDEEIELLYNDMRNWQCDLIKMRDNWRRGVLKATGSKPTDEQIKEQEQIIVEWAKSNH